MNNQERLDETVDTLMKNEAEPEAIIATLLVNIAKSLATIADIMERKDVLTKEQEHEHID